MGVNLTGSKVLVMAAASLVGLGGVAAMFSADPAGTSGGAASRAEPAPGDAGIFSDAECAPDALAPVITAAIPIVDIQTVMKNCDGDQPGSARRALAADPTPLQVILADPPAYTDRFVLAYVRLEPSAYFNWSYGSAQKTHYAFEMKTLATGDGETVGPRVHGYAARSWAAPFFARVTEHIMRSGATWAPATVVVGFRADRMRKEPPDQLEIIAAEFGWGSGLDPTVLNEEYQVDARARAEKRQATVARATAEEARCPTERMRRAFINGCQGLYGLGSMMGGTSADSRPFCRCASDQVDYRKLRKGMNERCDFVNTQMLTATLRSDLVQNECDTPR